MKKVLFLLGELNDADVDWLVQVGKKEEVPAGTVLIHEGRPVDTLYVLLDGTLIVSISALEGRQIARLSSGDVVGEMSFIDSQPPSATVQTLENSMVLAVSRSLLSGKLQTDEGFGCRFYRALAILLSHRLRGTVKQIGTPANGAIDTPAEPPSAVEPALQVAQSRFERLLHQLETAS